MNTFYIISILVALTICFNLMGFQSIVGSALDPNCAGSGRTLCYGNLDAGNIFSLLTGAIYNNAWLGVLLGAAVTIGILVGGFALPTIIALGLAILLINLVAFPSPEIVASLSGIPGLGPLITIILNLLAFVAIIAFMKQL